MSRGRPAEESVEKKKSRRKYTFKNDTKNTKAQKT